MMKRIVVGFVAAGVLAFGVSGCSGVVGVIGGHTPTPTPVAVSTPAVFAISGTVSVPDWDGVSGTKNGDTCISNDGYDDIDSGAQVIVMDASGTQIAVGSLGDGWITTEGCSYEFTVDDVPDGQNLYQIHVGNEHRGDLTYKRSDLDGAVEIGF